MGRCPISISRCRHRLVYNLDPEATESVIGTAIFLGLFLIWALNKAVNEGWRPARRKRRCKACGEYIMPPESAVVNVEYTDDTEQGLLIPTPVTEEDDFFHFNCYEEMVRLKRFSEGSRRITEEHGAKGVRERRGERLSLQGRQDLVT